MKEPFMFEPWPFEDEYEFWNETGELNPDFFEEEWEGEINGGTPPGPILTAAPRVLTYTTNEVLDNRISVPAQHSLVRLSKNPATSADAVGMLQEIKAGRLAGIYCVNWEKSAQRALRLGSNWWSVIPQGEDAVLMLDPDNLSTGIPLIAFLRELDPRKEGCGSLRTDTGAAPAPARIDEALLKAWNSYQLWRQNRLRRCSVSKTSLMRNVIPIQFCLSPVNQQVGRCGVPPRLGVSLTNATNNVKYAYTSTPKSCGNRYDKCTGVDFETPKVCLFADDPENANAKALFYGMAARWACLSGAMNQHGSAKPVMFRTGDDILASLEAIDHLLDQRIPRKKIREVHIFAHMFEEGIIGASDTWVGLYRDYVVPYRSRAGCNPGQNCSGLNCSQCNCRIGEADLRSGGSESPISYGAKIIKDINLDIFDDNVVFMLHGCNTANEDLCWVVNSTTQNFAFTLYRHLASRLFNPTVFGHFQSICSGKNAFWRVYSKKFPHGENNPRKIGSIPYNDVGNICCP